MDTQAQFHTEAERIAIPDFDWFSQPIIAVAQGLADPAHPHRRDRGRWPLPPDGSASRS